MNLQNVFSAEKTDSEFLKGVLKVPPSYAIFRIMHKVKITAVKKVCHQDLIEKYENPIEHACEVKAGDFWISVNAQCPGGFCKSAWSSIEMFVFALANGAEDFYDGWMKNKKSALISCNDGFRPVSFLLETQ